jgi:hypothetical protein
MRTLRLSLVLLTMMIPAGCAPKDIAQSRCQSHPLTTADEWTCTVTGNVVASVNTIAFDTESRNQVAKVIVALQVTKGTLRLTYYDLTGQKILLVTPSEPANFTMETRLNRERRSFTVMFEPVDGPVNGLTGTVNYSTP